MCSEGGLLQGIGGGPGCTDVALSLLLLPAGAGGGQAIGHPVALHRGIHMVSILRGQNRGAAGAQRGDQPRVPLPPPPPEGWGLGPSPGQRSPPRSRASAGISGAGSKAGEAARGRWCGGPRLLLAWGLGAEQRVSGMGELPPAPPPLTLTSEQADQEPHQDDGGGVVGAVPHVGQAVKLLQPCGAGGVGGQVGGEEVECMKQHPRSPCSTAPWRRAPHPTPLTSGGLAWGPAGWWRGWW